MNKKVIQNYDEFIKMLKPNLSHWISTVERVNCRILVGFDGPRKSNLDIEYDEWCEENCIGKWFVYSEYYVFFDFEEDAMAFKLRWS